MNEGGLATDETRIGEMIGVDDLPRLSPLPKERENHSPRFWNVVRLDWTDGSAPKGLYHSARRWLIESGYAGLRIKNEINPDGVDGFGDDAPG